VSDMLLLVIHCNALVTVLVASTVCWYTCSLWATWIQ